MRETPRSLKDGVLLDTLEESPASAAYRVQLSASTTWSMPIDCAAFVLAGNAKASDGSNVKPGDTLPHGALVELRAGSNGLAMLLAGRELHRRSRL